MAVHRTIRKAVYPGSFDPVTNGHLALIQKASSLFDRVYVAVARNPSKVNTFSVAERVDMLRQAARRFRNVKVEAFEGLVVHYARRKGVQAIIRGLRAVSDFEMELQMALTNQQLDSRVETVFLLPSEEYFYISSGLIKEIAMLGGSIKNFVPAHVEKFLKSRFQKNTT